MSNPRRVLERQKREEEEIRHICAEEDRELDKEDEEIVLAVCMLHESRQHHRRSAPNVGRHRHSQEQVDEIDRMGKSTILECLVRFCDAIENLYTREYLRKPIVRDLQRLVQKTRLEVSQALEASTAVTSFDTRVWHAFFGVVGSKNDLNELGQSPVFNDVLRGHSPYITYQINNTVYSSAYYLADGIYLRGVRTQSHEHDIDKNYERSIGANGQPMKHELLIRDDRYNNPMIDPNQEMQSSYVHKRRQVDLIEHLWEMKGNHSG
ncbi:unnamed protein product [Prunus armeniaca]